MKVSISQQTVSYQLKNSEKNFIVRRARTDFAHGNSKPDSLRFRKRSHCTTDDCRKKFAEREEKNPDKYQKMSKCAEIVASLNKKTIQFCWRKAQLTDTEAQIECPNEMENIESAIQEERILNYIEEKMAALDIEDEEETVELVPLEEEPFIENEPILIDDERPMKKIKQEKITSFFLKK